MKKILLVATICVAGLASAKDGEVKTIEKKTEKKEAVKEIDSKEAEAAMQCMQVGMLVWCTDEVVTDTVCWGEGSGTATYEQAVSDSIRNSQLLTEFTCGAGTGSGPGGN
ncbi:hypothetical protein CHRYSEOSP005_15070 [Chryseobacterium sp. Alg-005]|uniref:hypothetical protein n=1 Tax=Chryseobacterium sp. Alg-005 TaxID=3159516 RepID=UPI003555AF5D